MLRMRCAACWRRCSTAGSTAGGAGRVIGCDGAMLTLGSTICSPLSLMLTLRKACTSESESTRYLPSLTEDSEYITTKKANSRVMKSA